MVPLNVVIGTAAVTLLVALGIGRLLGAGRARSALAASLLILLALTYGHAWNLRACPPALLPAHRLTPVNLFRVVFNAAFDAELPILPERNWIFVDQRHLYDFVDVTDRAHHP